MGIVLFMVRKIKGAAVIGKALERIDQYGQQVALTLNGEKKTKTSLGGGISLILGIVLLCYGGDTLVKTLTTPFDWKISKKESYLTESDTKIDPHTQQFIEAIGVEDYMTKSRNKVNDI